MSASARCCRTLPAHRHRAQGGTGKDIAGFFRGGVRGVVNSSAGHHDTHKGKSEDARFVDHVRAAVLDMKKDILQQL
ncbi:MAG: hypothetical protein R2912_11555 [Eubacteriales bacterium]